ncbi:MAG: TfoX/Sxy family protein [Gemmatimonadota bacterium]
MSVTPSYRTFVLDQLARVATAVRGQAMFGGLGIYSSERFFALADDDTLYLKADDLTRPEFEAAGMKPFRPFGEDGETMSYYGLPADLLEDAEALTPWVDLALEAARRKRRKPRRGKSA